MPTLDESVERWAAEVGPDALAAGRARAAAVKAERRQRESFDLCRELNALGDPRCHVRLGPDVGALVCAGRYVEAAGTDPAHSPDLLAMERASRGVEAVALERRLELERWEREQEREQERLELERWERERRERLARDGWREVRPDVWRISDQAPTALRESPLPDDRLTTYTFSGAA
jgi:hypothetical protein